MEPSRWFLGKRSPRIQHLLAWLAKPCQFHLSAVASLQRWHSTPLRGMSKCRLWGFQLAKHPMHRSQSDGRLPRALLARPRCGSRAAVGDGLGVTRCSNVEFTRNCFVWCILLIVYLPHVQLSLIYLYVSSQKTDVVENCVWIRLLAPELVSCFGLLLV